jgi:hypothetical protein
MSKAQKSSSKLLAPVCWNKDGILFVDSLKKGATIMAKYYVPFIDKLKQHLFSKL